MRRLPVTTPPPGGQRVRTGVPAGQVNLPSFLGPFPGGLDTDSLEGDLSPEAEVLTLLSRFLNHRDCSPGSDWSDLSRNLDRTLQL